MIDIKIGFALKQKELFIFFKIGIYLHISHEYSNFLIRNPYKYLDTAK